MRFIDDDIKSKLTTPKKNPDSPGNLNHSFDNALKDNYSEFSFVSPTTNNNSKPKIHPKPSLSLDTFEGVVNELNLTAKRSIGKKLFDKQQLKDDHDKIKPVNQQLENVQHFAKRNSIRKSSKINNKNTSISYDEKPIVLFTGNGEGLVNSAFAMDELVVDKPVKEIRPPTPPPRADKPLSCLKTEEANYNLNMPTVVDKSCYIQEIHSSRKSVEVNSDTNDQKTTTGKFIYNLIKFHIN